MSNDRYLEPQQARRRAPTQHEDLLGDALERAFSADLHDLPAIVTYLNACGPSAENGQAGSRRACAHCSPALPTERPEDTSLGTA